MSHDLPGNYNRDLVIIFKCRLADLEVVTVDSSLNSWTWIKTDFILNENVSAASRIRLLMFGSESEGADGK